MKTMPAKTYVVPDQQTVTEERLRESEALYRALVNTSPDAILLTDTDGRIIMANARAAELFEYPATEQLIGRTIFEMMAPGERDRAMEEGRCVMQQRCLRDHEYLFQRRDGSRFPAEMSAALIPGNDGQPRGVIVVARDITERKRAEKRLRERDEQYHSIFESTSDGIVITDMDGFVVEANPAACALFGYTREEFIGLRAEDYIHPDYRTGIPEYVETIKREGWISARIVNVRKDGTSFPADVRGTSFLYWGKPRVLAMVRDATEQVKAQELLEKRVLERTRELSTLLEVSRQVASTLRFEPLMSIILEQLRDIVDYRGGSLLKLNGNELVIVEYRGPNPREEVVGLRFPLERIGPIWEVASQGRPVMICDVHGDDLLARTFREAAGPLMDGIWSYVRSWMGIPLVQRGKVMGLLSLATDEPSFYTDEHAHLALALASQAAVAMENAKLYKQAQEAAALEERARLARELHDSVTQALFSMTMHAEAAQMALERDAGQPAALRPQGGVSGSGSGNGHPDGPLRRNLRQLSELSEGALAEMRALIFELRPGALQEEGLAAALRKHTAALSAREGIGIEVQAPDDRIPLDPDAEEHIYRGAQEALHNVVKHAGAGQVIVRLEADAGQPAALRPQGGVSSSGRLVLEVQDDGVGFDPATVPAGHLGLRTMADRMEQIGGALEIESAPGAGTTVRICAPSETVLAGA
jgi:PAS domain S-box-containing protein